MTILSDIRQHLIEKNLVTSSECKLNIASSMNEQVVLWQYGGYQVDIGQQPTIQIKTMSLSQQTAETKINNIFDELIKDSLNKYKILNSTKMWVVANQQPFFLEKDNQDRYIFVFNITVTAFR